MNCQGGLEVVAVKCEVRGSCSAARLRTRDLNRLPGGMRVIPFPWRYSQGDACIQGSKENRDVKDRVTSFARSQMKGMLQKHM